MTQCCSLHDRCTDEPLNTLLFKQWQTYYACFSYTHCCVFQGGAAFWRNLYNNGTGNPLTLHAACPVLEGYKWGKLSSWFFVSYPPVLLTASPRQEATWLMGERPNLYWENNSADKPPYRHIISYCIPMSHPQWEDTLTYEPRLVGEHK